MSMTKQELIKTVANSAAITLKEAEGAVNTLVDLLVDEVKTEGRFALAGVGVFTQVTRAAKTGRGPRDGSPINIPEKKAVKFKPAVSFKEAVNG
jgi:DNA-binding protein HU-beta